MKQLYKDPINMVICGVGGQGNILASELLGSALVEQGYFVTIGETYGASQRGGSVMSHLRLSATSQQGPLIARGDADFIIGFEPIETLRVAREYGHAGSRVIVNPRPNYPLGVLTGETVYPDIKAIVNELNQLCARVDVIEATALAQQAGNAQMANIVLMGAVAALPEIPLALADYEQVLAQRFQDSALNLNRQAFNLGYQNPALRCFGPK